MASAIWPQTIIGTVSKNLKERLKENIWKGKSIDFKVTFLPPEQSFKGKGINLFLYQVKENPFLKNADWKAKSDNPKKLSPPPLSLSLFYIITPYDESNTGGQDGQDNPNEHDLLSEAMRVFYENPVIVTEAFNQHQSQQIEIIHNPLGLEELGKIWNAFNKPFKLSVAYEVSVVQIESLKTEERAKPVKEVVLKPSAGTPIVHRMSPESDQPNQETEVTFTGEYLDGYRAEVVLGKKLPYVTVEKVGSEKFTYIGKTLPKFFTEIVESKKLPYVNKDGKKITYIPDDEGHEFLYMVTESQEPPYVMLEGEGLSYFSETNLNEFIYYMPEVKGNKNLLIPKTIKNIKPSPVLLWEKFPYVNEKGRIIIDKIGHSYVTGDGKKMVKQEATVGKTGELHQLSSTIAGKVFIYKSSEILGVFDEGSTKYIYILQNNAKTYKLSENTFTFTIPSLAVGVYPIQVNISGLFQKTFLFEVK
jgi:hypothetical protein